MFGWVINLKNTYILLTLHRALRELLSSVSHSFLYPIACILFVNKKVKNMPNFMLHSVS